MLFMVVLTPLALIVAAALAAHARLGLRSRAASRAPRPAWDLRTASSGGWRALESAEGDNPVASGFVPDLGPLFDRASADTRPMAAPGLMEER